MLCGENVDLAGLSELTLGELPVSVHRLSALHLDAPAVLGLRGDETWVVRPDAHIAATLTAAAPSTVRAAVRRAVAPDTRATA